MSKDSKHALKLRYESLHRYFAAIVVVVLMVTAGGSAVGGSTTVEILWRCVLAWFLMTVLGRVVIKTWATWEETRYQDQVADKAKELQAAK